MDHLKNDFQNQKLQIEIECDGKIANKGGNVIDIEANFSCDKYKSIRIIKDNGDWPDEMWISWDNGNFDLITEEIISHIKKDKEISLSFKKEFDPTKIDDFEIQIKRMPSITADPDTTVTIGEAKPGESTPGKKKKG